jgi:hypothetical protein
MVQSQRISTCIRTCINIFTDCTMGDHKRVERDGTLAAAVSYHDGFFWQSISSSPEWNTDKASDAEKEGLRLAFRLAYDPFRFSSSQPLNSSPPMNMFFADCQDIVKVIAGIRIRKVLGFIPNSHQHQHKWARYEIVRSRLS